MVFLRLFSALTTASALHATSLVAHEFWIEPQNYQVESGDNLVADLRNGQQFKGSALTWFDRNFTRFDMVSGESVIPVPGRIGDIPALNTTAPGDGLLIVLHETTPNTLKYKEWEKFMAFAAHKDFKTAARDHDTAGWPRQDFRETYTRHVKALIGVGDGEGSDRAFGLTTEFVALSNPYSEEFDGFMSVQVNYEGDPRVDAQVEVFDKAPDDSVTISLTRTDDTGQARIPVVPGHRYLLDAVVLRPASTVGSSDSAPVWETLWAALTFAVPER